MNKDSDILSLVEDLVKNLKDVKKILSKKTLSDWMQEYDELKRMSIDELFQTVKLVMNYEEKNTRFYTLKESIEWFKKNFPKKGGYDASVYMEKYENFYKLHHFFIDSNKDPKLGEMPYLVVVTIKIDDELINVFGSKDLIILQ